jgi:hypothetical protein
MDALNALLFVILFVVVPIGAIWLLINVPSVRGPTLIFVGLCTLVAAIPQKSFFDSIDPEQTFRSSLRCGALEY